MDEIFDKIKKGMSKTKDEAEKLTKVVVNKTSNMVGITKLNFALNETESKMNKIYAGIGKYIYEKHLSGADLDSELCEFCIEIDKFSEEVKDIKEKIAALKDSLVCPSCGEYNNKENEYCAKCGIRLSDYESSDTDKEVEVVTSDDNAVDDAEFEE